MSATGRQAMLLALIILAVSNKLTTALSQQTLHCANDNTPMCGRSHGEYLLFKNECDLRKAQRENLMDGPLFDVALHNCMPSCEFECDQGYQPICGVSVASGKRKSFRNRCEMMRTACYSKSEWLVYKWGVCPSQEQSKKSDQRKQQPAHTVLVAQRVKRRRPVPCTNVYRPVCASYAGVKSTFSNECLVKAENLRTRRNWRIISEGLCGEDSTKMMHNRKYKPNSKPKVERERSKRSSYMQPNHLDDFEISEDAVQIFAPSTFHTQFISNSGTMEKSYSLPARKPYLAARPKTRRIYGSSTARGQVVKSCVFSNEPVCGSFNGQTRTFTNVCELMEYSQTVGHAWTILYEGSCQRCDKPCPTVYSPICVNRNGLNQTIINECYLERMRCKEPNSDWKIAHKGECKQSNKEVSHIPSPSPRIPHMLYAAKQRNSSSSPTTRKPTTTPSSPTAIATVLPRRQLRKPKRPTPTPKDLSNRKIRKIELEDGFELNMPSKDTHTMKLPATSKLWSTKDNRRLHQSLDNVKDKFSKKTSSKKAHSAKHPYFNWQLQPTTKTPQLLTTTAAPTTTTGSTLNTFESIADADLLNLDIKSVGEIYGEIEADSQILLMVDITTQATTARTIEDETTTTSATTAETSSTTTTTVPLISESTTISPSTKAPKESTSSSTIAKETSQVLDPNTAATSTETTTVAADKLTTPNLDYNADEPLSTQSEQTSIYGLDKNSLIMRLLRARSSKNTVL